MEQRQLGRSGVRVSRLALGTMTWGRDTDEHEAAEQFRFYLDAGGNFIDTAAVYGDGDAERVLGGLLGVLGNRDEIVLATKAGISFKSGERKVDNSRTSLINDLEKSLTRLKVDYVDLWQVHTWDETTPLEETLSAMDYALSSGKARHVGVSNFSGFSPVNIAADCLRILAAQVLTFHHSLRHILMNEVPELLKRLWLPLMALVILHWKLHLLGYGIVQESHQP